MNAFRLTLVACGIAQALLLAGCAGDGGERSTFVAPPPTPAPPPEPCPEPITGDCVVSADGTMTGGRDSDAALIIDNGAALNLDSAGVPALYAFDGGTRVGRDGAGSVAFLSIQTANTLRSNLENWGETSLFGGGFIEGDVTNHGSLYATGTITGNVDNNGILQLRGSIDGDLANRGRLEVDLWEAYSGRPLLVTGDYRQAAGGTLSVFLEPNESWADQYAFWLDVGGRAILEGGTLEMKEYFDSYGYYALPEPGPQRVLHAEGGVVGFFDRWTSPGLFVEGRLRYEVKDIWFDLERISVQRAMSAQGASAMTLASAANLDRSLAGADRFARQPRDSLTHDQRSFLRNASALMFVDDPAQATRSLDSIGGSVHPRLARQLLDATAGLDGSVALPDAPAGWQAGYSGGWVRPSLATLDGKGSADGIFVAGHLHRTGGAGRFAGIRAEAAQYRVRTSRTLDLAGAGRHVAFAEMPVSVAMVQAEAGMDLAVGSGSLVPRMAAGVASSRTDGFAEAGQTGFELLVEPTARIQPMALASLSYVRAWDLPRDLHVRFDAGGRLSWFGEGWGEAWTGAHAAVPDVRFALPDDGSGTERWLDFGIAGDRGGPWRWTLRYSRPLGGFNGEAWWVAGMQRGF